MVSPPQVLVSPPQDIKCRSGDHHVDHTGSIHTMSFRSLLHKLLNFHFDPLWHPTLPKKSPTKAQSISVSANCSSRHSSIKFNTFQIINVRHIIHLVILTQLFFSQLPRDLQSSPDFQLLLCPAAQFLQHFTLFLITTLFPLGRPAKINKHSSSSRVCHLHNLPHYLQKSSITKGNCSYES